MAYPHPASVETDDGTNDEPAGAGPGMKTVVDLHLLHGGSIGREMVDGEAALAAVTTADGDAMSQLLAMGFCNRDRNAELIEKHKGDVSQCVEAIVTSL